MSAESREIIKKASEYLGEAEVSIKRAGEYAGSSGDKKLTETVKKIGESIKTTREEIKKNLDPGSSKTDK
jgi:hypothetical protein